MEYKRKTIENDEEYLRQISEEVDFSKDDYMEWVKALKDYCESDAVYALAPVQIGIPKRIIYLRNTTSDMDKNNNSSYNENEVLINPVILSERGKTRFLEGCASCVIGDYLLVGEVERPYSVEVEYYDLKGFRHQEVFEGFKTTVFCHEYDHLNGVLHIDKVGKIMRMNLDEMKEYRASHPYEILEER